MFKKFPQQEPHDPLDALRSEVAAASRAVADARQAFGDAVLDAPGSASREPLIAAQERLKAAQEALVAGETVQSDRNAKAAARAQAKALADRWAAAEAGMKARDKAAKTIESQCHALIRSLKQLSDASLAIAETQLTTDLDGTMLLHDRYDMAVRCCLAKAARIEFGGQAGMRFSWLAKGVPSYVIDELPPLTERIEAANDYFRKQKVGP